MYKQFIGLLNCKDDGKHVLVFGVCSLLWGEGMCGGTWTGFLADLDLQAVELLRGATNYVLIQKVCVRPEIW